VEIEALAEEVADAVLVEAEAEEASVVEADVVDSEEVEDEEALAETENDLRCTMRCVPIVAMTVKYLSDQRATNQYIAATASSETVTEAETEVDGISSPLDVNLEEIETEEIDRCSKPLVRNVAIAVRFLSSQMATSQSFAATVLAEMVRFILRAVAKVERWELTNKPRFL